MEVCFVLFLQGDEFGCLPAESVRGLLCARVFGCARVWVSVCACVVCVCAAVANCLALLFLLCSALCFMSSIGEFVCYGCIGCA